MKIPRLARLAARLAHARTADPVHTPAAIDDHLADLDLHKLQLQNLPCFSRLCPPRATGLTTTAGLLTTLLRTDRRYRMLCLEAVESLVGSLL